jgi:hypothetical protein
LHSSGTFRFFRLPATRRSFRNPHAPPMNRSPRWSILLFSAVSLLPPCAVRAAGPDPTTVTRTTYHGWPDSIVLGNGVVEAVIVPAVGRVMQFRFAGSADGPFWENEALRGSHHDAASKEWSNFGGDKAWPAPQADWPRRIGRDWPPPAGFDSMPMTVEIDRTGVTLVSQVDPGYGIRVRRRIELAPGLPVMTTTTRYENVAGAPLSVGVWTITQLKDPIALYAPLAGQPSPGGPRILESGGPPPDLAVTDDLLSLTRDRAQNRKIGLLGRTLVWLGRSETLRLDSELVGGAPYPDEGRSAQIYTNADPLAYVELEMLGPLETLRTGDAIERTTTYTLGPRTAREPAAEIPGLLRGSTAAPQAPSPRPAGSPGARPVNGS